MSLMLQYPVEVFYGKDTPVTFAPPAVLPVGFASFALRFVVAVERGKPALLTKTGGSIVVDPTTGQIVVFLSVADTTTLGPGVFVYELDRTDSGYTGILAWGSLVVIDDVH